MLHNVEDMKLFSDETGYMIIIYLGATSSQNHNSHDQYIWTDQSHFQFLTNIVTPYASGVDIYTADTGHVKRIPFLHMDGSGKCVALLYFPLVMAWRVVSIPCDVKLNVSIYCSAMVKQSAIGYKTALSSIRIGFAENNFATIKKGRSCSKDDYYYYFYNTQWSIQWFQQDEICLRIIHCDSQSSCNYLSEVCKPHDIYIFPYKDAHSLTFNKSSHIAKF